MTSAIPKTAKRVAVACHSVGYDQGGQRVAYFDKTPGNAGGKYRQDDVDIWRCGPSNYYFGAVNTGEWLDYTIDVPHNGEYRIDIRLGTPNNNRQVHVEFDGEDKTGPLTVPNTGWWTYWETMSAAVTLSAGRPGDASGNRQWRPEY